MSPSRLVRPAAVAVFLIAAMLACVTRSDSNRYRLAGSGDHWDVAGEDRVFDDLRPRYESFFDVVLDPNTTRMPDVLGVRGDLERTPVDHRNYDALNAVAIAYFETNFRAEGDRGTLQYLSLSQNAAMLLAVPWRAYSQTGDTGLREAILDFFEDAGGGEKLRSAATAPRLARIVASLAKKEDDPVRRARIQAIARNLGSEEPTGSE